MSFSRRLFVLFLLVVASSIAATPTAEFQKLLEEEWQYTLKEDPLTASSIGDLRYNDLWPDISLPAINSRIKHTQQTIDRLKKINRSQLKPAERINYDLLLRDCEESIKLAAFRRFLVPMTTYDGIQNQDSLASYLRFTTVKDYEDWIARLRRFPAYMDQTMQLMKQGIKERQVQPKLIVRKLSSAVETQIVDDAAKSGFYKPFTKFGTGVSAADQSRLQSAARQAIRDQVIPAYRSLKQFLDGEYLQVSFDGPGVLNANNGKQLYVALAQQYTTTNMTPDEIHQVGLREVSRIKDEMQTLMVKSNFKGSLREFFVFLRTDPKFSYRDSQTLLEAYRAMAKRIDGTLLKVFHRKTLPRTPYGVEAIPDNSAPFTTTGYYGPPALDGSRSGTYWVNLYKPETRYTHEMMALSLHESVPGHHLQIAIQQEQGALPKFRQNAQYTAYVEGWALYAESLGDELGLYDDPYSKFGRLTYDMWRACRLVVDTGMHYFGWDKQKALNFFLENTPKSDQDANNEVDRYISWPGQALGYKIGELKIRQLRERAQTKFGSKFNLKDFHHEVLTLGPVPVEVLEQHIDQWIAVASK
jgi:uncharacterized protein (DUF885 family)